MRGDLSTKTCLLLSANEGCPAALDALEVMDDGGVGIDDNRAQPAK